MRRPAVRKIIHCDCDCFYAAIEMRDDPRLVGRPLAVGGRPERRGVVATCNYEARKFGIHSAMPMAQAVKRCPDLLIVPPAMDKYRQVARQIFAIYQGYTPLVEPLSLDEAYLDVTDSPMLAGSGTRIAEDIRRRVHEEIGITVSAGVAPNKFIAKIASDWNKPDGLFVVRPEQVDAFVAALPVERLFGVGKVTAAKLRRLGAQTCGDLRGWGADRLQQHFGSFGFRLHDLCRGIDHRQVQPSQIRKSVSVEETYATDLRTLDDCQRELTILVDQLAARVERARAGDMIHKTFVKLRFADFRGTTVECVYPQVALPIFNRLLAQGFERRRMPVRLLGVGVRLHETDAHARQQALFAEDPPPRA
ncbi:DNA polymerase IV [Ralstonia pseudosolanacearum]